MNNIWQIQDAENQFKVLVDQAITQGKQIIIRDSEKLVVVIAFDEYEQITRREGKLSEYLLSSPLKEMDISFDRGRDQPRMNNLEA
jgi:hypothetical protein